MSERKRNFSEDNFLRVSLESINRDEQRPFPLYIYLPKNNHLILLAHENEDLNRSTLKRLERQNQNDLWCPIEYKSALDAYGKNQNTTLEHDYEIKTDEGLIAHQVIHDKNLTEDQKKAILSNVSQNLVANLYRIDSDNSDESKKAIEQCKAFAEDIVKVGLNSKYSSDLWDEIERIKQEVGLEHSTTTSSFAVIFAMGIGHSDPEYLTDISTASLLHDIGFVKLDFSLLSIPEQEFDEQQRIKFQKHVEYGVNLLKQRNFEIPQRVLEAVEQHHERFDGSGYPNALKGFQISEMAQIMAIADLFDDIMTGRFDGHEKSAKDSLKNLENIAENEKGSDLFDPDLFKRFLHLLKEGESLSADQESPKSDNGNAA